MSKFLEALAYFLSNGLDFKLAKELAEKVSGVKAPTGKIEIPEIKKSAGKTGKEGVESLDDVADARLIEQMYRTAGPRSLDEDKMYLAEFIADDAGKVLDDLPASEQKVFIDRAERALIKNVKKYQDLPPPGSRGGPDDIAAPFSDEKVELPKGVRPEDTILPTGSLISKRLKTMRIADEIKPGLFENLTDTQTEIIDKYGDLVDMDLLKNIVLDPDPNNQAAALATLEEAMVLMKKGVGPDEAIDILKKGSRTKQAEGGLSYLMGM